MQKRIGIIGARVSDREQERRRKYRVTGEGERVTGFLEEFTAPINTSERARNRRARWCNHPRQVDRVAPGNLRYVVAIVCACSNFAWRRGMGQARKTIRDGIRLHEKPSSKGYKYCNFVEKNISTRDPISLDYNNSNYEAICKVFFFEEGDRRILALVK